MISDFQSWLQVKLLEEGWNIDRLRGQLLFHHCTHPHYGWCQNHLRSIFHHTQHMVEWIWEVKMLTACSLLRVIGHLWCQHDRNSLIADVWSHLCFPQVCSCCQVWEIKGGIGGAQESTLVLWVSLLNINSGWGLGGEGVIRELFWLTAPQLYSWRIGSVYGPPSKGQRGSLSS